jgi:hypothetical protein
VILTKKQTELIDKLEDNHTIEVLFGGGAGGAKSFGGVYWLLKCCLRYPGTRWVMGRWKRKYLIETTLNSFWEVCKLQGVKPVEHYNYNSQAGTITFYNGSQILLKDLFTYPSDPNFDSLGSLEITGAFIDEANQVDQKAKDILRSRIRYKLDVYDLIPKILYTCNPAKNWVYTEFYKPAKANNLNEKRAFIQALATDNPFISEHYIETLNDLPQVSKERLLFGNWEYDDDASTLIDYDSILDLYTNDHVPTGDKVITADIARFGKDKTVVMVWDGYRVIDIKELAISSVAQSVELINQLKTKYGVGNSNIISDSDGVGGGVTDFIKGSFGFVNGAKPIKRNKNKYQNLKTQCYYVLSEMVNEKKVFIDNDLGKADLIQELEYVKMWKMDDDTGTLKIMPKDKVKEHIGRSPDYSDCLAMRVVKDLRVKSSYS